MAERIEVKAVLKRSVEVPIAETLCENFLEWLDVQGFTLAVNEVRATKDERSYAELATDYILEMSER